MHCLPSASQLLQLANTDIYSSPIKPMSMNAYYHRRASCCICIFSSACKLPFASHLGNGIDYLAYIYQLLDCMLPKPTLDTRSHQNLTVNAIATVHGNLRAMFQHEIIEYRWLRYARVLPHIMVNMHSPKVLVAEVE